MTKARKIMIVCVVTVVVALMILLIIGYTQPLSAIRVEVYNCWSTEVSFTICIDKVTDGQVYHMPSSAMKVVGVWSVHPGNHNVSLVSDDFPKMVYNTKVLSMRVYVGPYETRTSYWPLAGQ
jgi:hypothetical protein